jgi:hypothetical protein
MAQSNQKLNQINIQNLTFLTIAIYYVFPYEIYISSINLLTLFPAEALFCLTDPQLFGK